MVILVVIAVVVVVVVVGAEELAVLVGRADVRPLAYHDLFLVGLLDSTSVHRLGVCFLIAHHVFIEAAALAPHLTASADQVVVFVLPQQQRLVMICLLSTDAA